MAALHEPLLADLGLISRTMLGRTITVDHSKKYLCRHESVDGVRTHHAYAESRFRVGREGRRRLLCADHAEQWRQMGLSASRPGQQETTRRDLSYSSWPDGWTDEVAGGPVLGTATWPLTGDLHVSQHLAARSSQGTAVDLDLPMLTDWHDGVTFVCSVLPWAGSGGKHPWAGSDHPARVVATLTALQPFLAAQTELVWGGD